MEKPAEDRPAIEEPAAEHAVPAMVQTVDAAVGRLAALGVLDTAVLVRFRAALGIA